MTAIPPPDETAHLDNLLMAEVTSLNNQLGRYVLRFLDADAGRIEPLSVANERVLADRVAAMAEGMHARAARREQDGEPLRLLDPAMPEAANG
jgi:hypothetical protein